MMIIWKCVFLSVVTSITIVSTNDVDCSAPDFHHKNGPRILPCVKELTLNVGQNFTLRCQGKTELKFMQQEISEERLEKSSYITTKTVKSDNPEYKHEIVVDLVNIDRYAIGYYACMDVSVKESEALNSLIMEPNDTEYISYIYIYVNGTDSLLAPMRELVTCKSNYYIVECRPSTSDVEVSIITTTSNKAPKKVTFSPKIGFTMKSLSNKGYLCEGRRGNEYSTVIIRNLLYMNQQNLSPPIITGTTREFLPGDTITLNCTVTYLPNSAIQMTWDFPNNNNFKNGSIIEQNNNNFVVSKLYKAITIVNATREHEGKYVCSVRNNCVAKNSSFSIKFLDKPKLNLIKGSRSSSITHPMSRLLILNVEMDAYPPANFTFYKNNQPIKSNSHYNVSFKNVVSEALLKIAPTDVEDTANYTLVAQNGYLNSSTTFDVRILAPPKINFGKNDDKVFCVQGMKTSFQCEVTGYPLPEVKWMFNGKESSKSNTRIVTKSLYRTVAYLDNVNCVDGNLTCWAKNTQKETTLTRELRILEMVDGFGISRQISSNDIAQWYPENQNVTIKCLASKYKFANVTWVLDGNDENKSVENSENQYSLVASLIINRISPHDAKKYICRGITVDGANKTDNIIIKVAAREDTVVKIMEYPDEDVHLFQPVLLSCLAQGVPRPEVTWYKDGEPLVEDSNLEVAYNELDHKTVNSSIKISHMQKENGGTYECLATSDTKVSQFFKLNIITEQAALTKYLIIIGAIIVVFIFLVIYLTWRDKKRKQRFKEELVKAGLLYFKKGATRSLNPELGIDEQAELLPYDERFEFAPEKLILGKQLGAGAFGVVYKAEARGIINAEETTTVAVKMVKKTADNMYIKALASELKIMIHLGKHINIVNLLGACTKNVVKRELVVIVEYCKFGNIHNYMQRHREVFIDQLSDNTKENNLGKVNIGFSHSGSTGVQSEYFGSVNTQDTFLNSANTNRPRQNALNPPSELAKASESYIQPEWRSNYVGDYSYEGRSPRPLSSRDLISWAFQIARGMEYLASRKVLHGDLAARNVLLADDNIVKICDFGLARSMYKNDEYQKKENSPLPVKWLAIECMTDRIFSTQSDVWSFGVVLWELFTLAKTPYPNISPSDILIYLLEGHRLNKPQYADDKIYNLMKRCWEQKPTARPTFSQLQEILDSYLEDSVRNHYVHLSSAYMDSRPAEQEDYLAMVCAPDYNNMVTPSPHHYVNNTKSFFPNTPTKVDEAGYQQMSTISDNGINSPMAVNQKFDFDARTFNTRSSDASNGGSELTPMLTLNNLPRSGSDSDHEAPVSSYLHAPCPTIDEDEVFQEKQKRNVQNSAVTNPTYITFDIDEEKKPLPVTSYVNVPNGLVK